MRTPVLVRGILHAMLRHAETNKAYRKRFMKSIPGCMRSPQGVSEEEVIKTMRQCIQPFMHRCDRLENSFQRLYQRSKARKFLDLFAKIAKKGEVLPKCSEVATQTGKHKDNVKSAVDVYRLLFFDHVQHPDVFTETPPVYQLPWVGTYHQFTVVSSDGNRERAFNALRDQYGGKHCYMFHGTTMDRLGPIAEHGGLSIATEENKLKANGSRFGNGIYMSPLLQLAAQFARPTQLSDKPLCHGSVVLILEVLATEEDMNTNLEKQWTFKENAGIGNRRYFEDRAVALQEQQKTNGTPVVPSIVVVPDEKRVRILWALVYKQPDVVFDKSGFLIAPPLNSMNPGWTEGLDLLVRQSRPRFTTALSAEDLRHFTPEFGRWKYGDAPFEAGAVEKGAVVKAVKDTVASLLDSVAGM